MISSTLFVASEAAVVDELSKALSIFNIIEEISPEGLPFFIQRFAICCYLKRDDLTSNQVEDIIFKIHNNEKSIFEHRLRIDFQNKSVNRAIMHLNGLQIAEAGKLKFSVFHSATELNKFEVAIVLRSEVQAVTA